VTRTQATPFSTVTETHTQKNKKTKEKEGAREGDLKGLENPSFLVFLPASVRALLPMRGFIRYMTEES
jgi:hypothetical protein